jgi:hypothetical protein
MIYRQTTDNVYGHLIQLPFGVRKYKINWLITFLCDVKLRSLQAQLQSGLDYTPYLT